MIFSFLAKTENDAENPGRFLARYNPRSMKMDFYDLEQNEQRMMPFEIKTQAVTSVVGMDKIVGEAQANGVSYFGGGWTQEFGSSSVVTHSIPRHTPVSLAAFQHSLANGFLPDSSGRVNNYVWSPATTDTVDYLMPQIDHAIGNSMASSLLGPGETEGAIGGGRPIADHSYLANEALWDQYFLSGISPENRPLFSEERDQQTVAREFLSGEKPLAVKHYKPNLQGRDEVDMLSAIIAGSSPVQGTESLTASLISVEGMFNVNSTSVEAWKAMLSGLRNRETTGQSSVGAEVTVAPDGATAIASLHNPIDAKVTSDSGSDLDAEGLATQWCGVHMIPPQLPG